MKLERKRRQEGFLPPWLAEPGGGDLVLETRPGEAVRFADRCVGHGAEEGCWARRPGGGEKVMASSSSINTLEGMAKGGTWEQRQDAGLGSYISRTWCTSLPTSGPPNQEKELRPSTWSLDSELHLFCYVWWKFKSTF